MTIIMNVCNYKNLPLKEDADAQCKVIDFVIYVCIFHASEALQAAFPSILTAVYKSNQPQHRKCQYYTPQRGIQSRSILWKLGIISELGISPAESLQQKSEFELQVWTEFHFSVHLSCFPLIITLLPQQPVENKERNWEK